MTMILERPQVGTTERETSRWQRRPVAAVALRTAIVVVPIAIATVVGLLVGRSIGGGGGSSSEIMRVGAAAAASILAIVLMERLVRRFLPLATLLRLSLVFPDQAPSRFAVALRSASVKKLQEWARTTQHDDGPAALAEKVVTLAAALNTHDRRTRGHSDRSRALGELLAVEMGLPESEVNEVRWGAFLHDIGKILVPAALLNKPGKPTPSEWEILKRHPTDGGELVEPLREFLGSGVEAVSGHHENYDGSGYPRGLAGTDIAMSARIVCVADSFEVMTAVRSYKKPMKASEARKELALHSGTQFDPTVVRALFNISLGRLHWSLGVAAWLAELPFLGVLPRAAAHAGALTAGPTVSVSTLSSVAAISLGSMVAQAPIAAVPAGATLAPPSGVVVQAAHRATVPGGSTTRDSVSHLQAVSTNSPSVAPSAAASSVAPAANSAIGGTAGKSIPSPSATSPVVKAVVSTLPTEGVPAPKPTLPSEAANHTLPPQAADPTLPPQAAAAAQQIHSAVPSAEVPAASSVGSSHKP
jgi:HD domain